MEFGAAFGVMAVIAAILFFAYVRLRKKYDGVVRERDNISARFDAKFEDLPALTKEAAAGVTEPLNKIMDDLNERLEKMGKENAGDRQVIEGLAKDAKTISEVLTYPQKRGQFSEIAIERILQMSGFEKDKHYSVQSTTEAGRPDFVVHLPDNRNIILDSKAPLNALQKSIAAEDEATKSQSMDEHVKAVKAHIKSLSGKEYWKESESLECVICVIPEYALIPALERDDNLTEYAWKNRVVLASPSILMVLVRAIDIIWKQNEMSDTVKEIGKLSADLHGRLATFSKHYTNTGTALSKLTKYYNEGVGSWDSRVKPAAEKLADAGAIINELDEVKPVDAAPRRLAGTE